VLNPGARQANAEIGSIMQGRQRTPQSQRDDAQLDATSIKVALVVSRFNEDITQRLLQGAQECLTRQGCPAEAIDVVWVPGAWEIPLAVRKMAQSSNYDAIVTLGAIIRGETPHFDVLANAVPQELARLQSEFDLPVILGVLTTNNVSQAAERAGSGSDNKGWEAALVAIEMAQLLRKLN
jgi:6,7-dimethyl-8-ribityllumazine synthase